MQQLKVTFDVETDILTVNGTEVPADGAFAADYGDEEMTTSILADAMKKVFTDLDDETLWHMATDVRWAVTAPPEYQAVEDIEPGDLPADPLREYEDDPDDDEYFRGEEADQRDKEYRSQMQEEYDEANPSIETQAARRL